MRRARSASAQTPVPAIPAAALLAPDLIVRASTEFGPAIMLIPVGSLWALRQLVGTLSTGLILTDPLTLLGTDGPLGWLREGGEPGWLPMVYSTPDPDRVRALLASARELPLPLVLNGFVGKSPSVIQYFDQSRAVSRSLRLLPWLTGHLAEVHPTLAVHIVATLASEDGAVSLKELSVRTRIPEPTVRHQMRLSGLVSGHRLLAAGRVARAWDEVAEQTQPLIQIARDHGFGTVGALRRQWKLVTGAELEAAIGVPFSDAIAEGIAMSLLVSRS